MLFPVGIWFLSVVFGTYLGHGLMVQLKSMRARKRWYVYESEEKRAHIDAATNPVDFWLSMGMQSFLFGLCIYGAIASL